MSLMNSNGKVFGCTICQLTLCYIVKWTLCSDSCLAYALAGCIDRSCLTPRGM